MALQHAHRRLGDRLRRRPVGRLLARDHHVGLEHHAFEQHAVLVELVEHAIEHLIGHLLAALDRMAAVHQHFRLDDRHDVVLLAQRCVARQRLRICTDGEGGRNALGNVDHRTPLREAGAEPAVLDQPLAQAVEPLGDGLAGIARERFRAGVDLDAGEHALLRQVLREGRAVLGLLAEGLVEHDDAADPLSRAGRGEQHFAIGAAMFLGRLQLDAVEAFLDAPGALVRGQDALAPGDHRAGHAHQLIRVHRQILSFDRLTARRTA